MAKAAASPPRTRTRSEGFDPASLVGLVGVIVVLAVAIMVGGTPLAFIDFPAIAIVIGGTTMVTLMSFPIEEFLRAPVTIARAMSPRPPDSSNAVARAGLRFAEEARRDNIMMLEGRLAQLSHRRVLHNGVAQLIDGARPEAVEQTLRREMAAAQDHSEAAEGVLRRAAEVAPAMGLIGTLIGLVQMLGQLDDPTGIGPAMAVALLTTLYGALLAHAVLTPMAEKLGRRAAKEAVNQELELLVVLAVAERTNPRKLQAALNSLLPAHERVEYFT